MLKFLKALRTEGRKGDAYDKALFTLFLLSLGAGSSGRDLSQGELDSLLMGLAGILATFIGGNAAEYGLKKPGIPTAPSAETPTEP